jgi:hypothetical protein
MSIVLMKIATQMTPRPRHRFSSPASCAEGRGAKWMKCATSMAAYLTSARSQATSASKSLSVRAANELVAPTKRQAPRNAEADPPRRVGMPASTAPPCRGRR